MVKNFDCSYDLDNKAKKYLEPLVINQFTSSNNDNAKYKTYNEHDLLNFVLDLTSSAFGTLFVASTIQSYINFIEKYDTKNIYELPKNTI